MKNGFISLLMLLTLSACASHIAPITPQNKAELRTIGIASVVGDSMNYTKIGFTVFTNENSDGDTSSWGLDEFVVSEITAKLSDKYKLVPVDMESATFRASDMPMVKAIMAAIKPSATPVDAYLVLVPTKVGDFIGGSYAQLKGLGIYRRPGYSIQAFAICDLLLIDAKSQALIGGGQLGFASGGLTFQDFLQAKALGKAIRKGELAHRKINPKLAQATVWGDFTPEQLDEIKEITKTLLRDSFDYPLFGMDLL